MLLSLIHKPDNPPLAHVYTKTEQDDERSYEDEKSRTIVRPLLLQFTGFRDDDFIEGDVDALKQLPLLSEMIEAEENVGAIEQSETSSLPSSVKSQSRKPYIDSFAKAAPLLQGKAKDGDAFVVRKDSDHHKMKVFRIVKGSADFNDDLFKKFIANTPIQGIVRWMKDVKITQFFFISSFL